MQTSDFFAADYAEARHKFRDAAGAAGARLSSYVNTLAAGPGGGALSTDTAWIGPADASRVLLLISGTHGVEGFCGSGVQVGTFRGGFHKSLPADTALLAVHAINPSGFAWLRRVTEDNIDLNRNFVDFGRALPRNEGYDALADAVCPAVWDEPTLAAAQTRLDAYLAEHGAAALQRAVTGGQYSHPDGIFYGGAAPSWSRRTIMEIARTHLGAARHVGAIDYHTGLGPRGHGERIVVHRPQSAALQRARDWYGEDVTSTALGTSASADVVGDELSGLEQALSGAAFTGMALEYGVRPLRDTLNAVRADNWLHLHGQVDSRQGREIKAMVRDAFYGDGNDWKDMIFEQAMDAQRRALTGLAS